MSNTQFNCHEVVGIAISELRTGNPARGDHMIRWQDITFRFADGGSHTVTAFLAEGVEPFCTEPHEDSPLRRRFDVQRPIDMNIMPCDPTAW